MAEGSITLEGIEMDGVDTQQPYFRHPSRGWEFGLVGRTRNFVALRSGLYSTVPSALRSEGAGRIALLTIFWNTFPAAPQVRLKPRVKR